MKILTHLVVLVSLAAGCSNNPYFSDDEGAQRSGAGPFMHPDELSQPYARGATINITVKHLSSDQASSYRVESDAPSILTIGKQSVSGSELTVECAALGTGDTTIRLRNGSGDEEHSAPVSVRAPDRAQLFAHGPLRIMGEDRAALASAIPESELRVLAGGTAVFAIAYFAGSDRLWGRGLFAPDAPAAVGASARTTSGAPSNEWLFVTPTAAGTSQLAVRVAGQALALATLPVVALSDGDLASAALSIETSAQQSDQQSVWVLASMRDTGGALVHGVYGGWTLDGVAQTGDSNPQQTTGDLYRFSYQPGGPARALVMTRGALSAQTTIQAHKGWVSDTTYLGCNVGRHGGSAGATTLALAALGLLLGRRRRRA